VSVRAAERAIRLAAALGVVLVVAGCGVKEAISADSQPEQSLVNRFHSELDQQHYAAIYADCDPILRQNVPEARYLRLLSTVHRKLGTFRSAELRSALTSVNPKGTFVTLEYSSKFSRGTAIEGFAWHRLTGGSKLAGYRINSDELIR